ncbi:hypothetical protein [Agarivorans sp. Z349TD_8]|uniref:hypothetical protein n=1 Tax=Agarivorans sp. Z349TD_8 TaxID=3421434 RepID=UPI003D7E2555
MAAFYLPRWQLGMIVPPSSGKAGYLQQGGDWPPSFIQLGYFVLFVKRKKSSK